MNARSRMYVPFSVAGCTFLMAAASRPLAAQEAVVASQVDGIAPAIAQSGAARQPLSLAPSALLGERLMVAGARARFSVAPVGLQPPNLWMERQERTGSELIVDNLAAGAAVGAAPDAYAASSAVGRPLTDPDGRTRFAGVPVSWPQPNLSLDQPRRTRSEIVALHVVAGVLVGAAAGYVVYRRTPEKESCDPKEGDLCGKVRAGWYMIIGGGIGMPVGALIGLIRTRR